MKYYQLMYDYEHDDNYVYCDWETDGSFDDSVLLDGVRIGNWDPAVFRCDPKDGGEWTDYIANTGRWLMVSERFCELAKSFLGDQVQYLPAKVTAPNGREVNHTCKILNVLPVLEALDLEHSLYDQFELDGEKIMTVEKYALKGAAVKGHHIFRLKEDHIPVFVSEAIRDVVEANRLTGFDFLKVRVCGN